MYTKLKTDNQGKITETVSSFNPSDAERDATALSLKDFQFAWTEQERGRREFNDRTLTQEADANQMAFNSYVPPKSDDPDESWRAQTVRPVTRNKLISIAAHVTANVLYPRITAQNSEDDDDQLVGEVMEDLVEWNIENSEYKKSFLTAVISALVDPAVILEVKLTETYREVKEIQADGTWKKKKILDEILSGFQFDVVSVKEILISNIYEPDIQKQRFVIRNRYVDYEEVKVVYGDRANFKYVQPGVRCVFDSGTRAFYDVHDELLKGYLVNETTYYNRYLDLELVYLNGILVSDPEQPMKRKDKLYPFAKGGYEPLNNGKYFYYKSAANKLGSDQQIVDTLYNMILDGTFLSLMPPTALYGSEEVSTNVFVPGSVTAFRDPTTKLEAFGPRADIRAGMESIQMVERSMSESSQDNLRGGTSGGGERTAREVVLMEKNAQIALGLFGKMVAFLVEDVGRLMIGDIIQHMTVAQVSEITGESKYRKFTIHDKMMEGRKVNKKIELVDPAKMPEMEGEDDYMEESYKLMGEEGGPESKTKIYKVNPSLIRDYRYKVRVNADDLTPKSKALDKALNLELYDRAIQNPTLDQEAITRDFLVGVYKPGDTDKYMKKATPMPPQGPTGPVADGGANPLTNGGIQQKGVSTSMLSQITGSNSLGASMSASE